MPKRISITLIFSVAIAIVVLFAATEVVAEPCGSGENTADYECTDGVQGNYTVRMVQPFPEIAVCPDNQGEKCTTYRWNIWPAAPSHFNLIVERPFLGKIVASASNGGPLDCTGSGDPSQGADNYAKFLTWNCFLKFNSTANPYVTLRGEFADAATDWFVKQTSSSLNGDYGITRGPSLSCVQIEPGQPITRAESFTTPSVTFDILFDEDGKSFDVVPTCTGCTVVTVSTIGDLRFGDAAGTVTWFPFDIPVSAKTNPTCTYVRTRSGGVKKVCP